MYSYGVKYLIESVVSGVTTYGICKIFGIGILRNHPFKFICTCVTSGKLATNLEINLDVVFPSLAFFIVYLIIEYDPLFFWKHMNKIALVGFIARKLYEGFYFWADIISITTGLICINYIGIKRFIEHLQRCRELGEDKISFKKGR